MATRCNIAVRIRPEDIGSIHKFDVSLLPEGTYYSDKHIDNIGDVRLKEYLSVYSHWDGYPSGVGEVLFKKYNDYNTILNLLCGGSISSLDIDGVSQYCSSRGEDWNGTKPKTSDTLPKCEEEYIYLFENNEWFVAHYRKPEEWSKLEEKL